jgi:hypothetical protein
MKLTTFVAASGLVLAASPLVWAQAQPPQGDPQQAKPPAAAAPSETMQPKWYTLQGSEIRASKLIGTTVVNTANETVGDINEVILGKDGKVAAVVLGIGGFLGMGEREVAVDFSSLKLTQDGNKTVVTINATKDVLKNAPEWKWAGDRSGTTGTGSPPANRPSK